MASVGSRRNNRVLSIICALVLVNQSFAFTVRPTLRSRGTLIGGLSGDNEVFRSTRRRHLQSSDPFNFLKDDDDDDDDDDDYEVVENDQEDDDEEDDDDDFLEDPYERRAKSEFLDQPKSNSGLVRSSPSEPKTTVDWGGALGKLRERLDDVASGKSQDPSNALFRLMSSQSPNQAIGSFVNTANPQVVQAMSGAVSSLLGGLSNPQMGHEVIVKASGDKIANLCLQLQMTGYMFRNAEYVMALKEIMDLRGSATLQDYKDAFDRLDSDGSGYIESSEVKDMLDDLYAGKTPAFEVDTFLNFFDQNQDGKISWEEFERGLGTAMSQQAASKKKKDQKFISGTDDDDDDDDEASDLETEISGTIEIEMANGKVVEVEAKEYIKSLKAEAQALKDALRKEKFGGANSTSNGSSSTSAPRKDDYGSIETFILKQQGNLKALTEGISPEIVEAMRMLVDFVLAGSDNVDGKELPTEEMEMEIPASALQQLALWQLILGYRLREAEAKGDYLKLLDSR
jgi:hypothetical protein